MNEDISIIYKFGKSYDEEMRNLGKYLMSCNVLGSKIINEKNVILSTLNSLFIRKIEIDNLLSEIFELDKIINNYIERKEIIESIYIWISNIFTKYNKNFKLYLPKFTKSDIFYLYLQCEKCNKKESGTVYPIYMAGPLLSDLSIKDNFIGNLRDEIDVKKIKNNPECITRITSIIYNKLFDNDSPLIEDYELLKNKF